jgi:transcriptional regulator with XRE-family HTH domain
VPTMIKKRLREKELNQRQFAKLINKSETWVSLVCNSKLIPTRDERRLVATALGLPMKKLWPGMPTKAEIDARWFERMEKP